MKLTFPPFDKYIKNHTTPSSRNRYKDSTISQFKLSQNEIWAEVLGTFFYQVRVRFNDKKVIEAQCTYPYDYSGACKHIIHALVRADEEMHNKPDQNTKESQKALSPSASINFKKEKDIFLVKNKKVHELTLPEIEIMGNSPNRLVRQYSIDGAKMPADAFIAQIVNHNGKVHEVAVKQKNKDIILECNCDNSDPTICPHIQHVLVNLHNLKSLLLSFDKKKRYEAFSEQTEELGIGESENLNDYFELQYDY